MIKARLGNSALLQASSFGQIVAVPQDTISRSPSGEIQVNTIPVGSVSTRIKTELDANEQVPLNATQYAFLTQEQSEDEMIPALNIISREKIEGVVIWRVWPPNRFGPIEDKKRLSQ